MKHEIILPPPHLKRFVRYFWTIDFFGIAEDVSTFKVFARRFPRIVFQNYNGHSAIYNGPNKLPMSYIGGLNTQPYTCNILPSISVTGVSFYPSAIKLLFRTDGHELVNELPDLENFVSKELTCRVIDAHTQGEKIKIIIDYLTRMIKNVKSNNISENAWQFVSVLDENSKLQDLPEIFNVSERQLIRNFYSTVGMSPKQFLRITRFEKSIQLMATHNEDNLSNIAYTLKYSDQSHFIREFKEFSHYTPLKYLKQQKLYQENSAIMVR